MQVQIYTQSHIDGHERMEAFFKESIATTLKRFEDKVTRLEVHISDENNHKTADNDKRCVIEARVAGMAPIAVTNHSDTTEKAILGAIDKIKKSLEHAFDKLRTH